MAASGYSYNTNKGENIAAGQSTAALVMGAWKASPGHDANMLSAAYKVIGVSFYTLSGSPYTYYWTTDFGGYVDPTAHAVGSTPSSTTTRYQQNDSHFVYSGTWYAFSTSGASGGSYRRVNVGSASVTVTFTGTSLAWIATTGTTLSKAYVSLDGGAAQSVDLAGPRSLTSRRYGAPGLSRRASTRSRSGETRSTRRASTSAWMPSTSRVR